MSTLQEVIDTTLNDFLLAGQRESRNVLASGVTDSATSLTVTYPVKGIQEGARVAVDFEDMWVVSSDVSAKTATVVRGQFGTAAAAHDTGDTVWVNPKWSYAQVLRAVNAELDALSGQGLFQMATLDLTFTAPVSGYDLTGVTADDLIDVYDVRADSPGPSKGWAPIQHYTLVRDADTSDFASGLGLVLHQGGYPGHTVRVTYKKRFSQVTSSQASTDLSSTAGVDREAHDLLALGAAIRLVAGKEVQRNQLNVQPGTRRAEEVPPGASLGSTKMLRELYRDRLAQEKSRLARRYPPRKAVAA